MKIEEWLQRHKVQMTEDIGRLVQIPSIAGKQEGEYPFGAECARAARCMLELAEKYGLWAEDCGGRCVKIHYGQEKTETEETLKKKIEIWNHLDVVPQGEGWIYEPFSCQVKGDFLIGRGVSDNKGPAIAVLYALRYLKEQGITLHYDLSQVCGLGEEIGMEDAAWYVEHYGSPSLSLISDCRFPVCHGEMGRCQLTLETTEEMVHIKELSAGVASNSVADSARLVLQGQRNQEKGTLTLTAAGIAGHAAAPASCVNPIGRLAHLVEQSAVLELTDAERRLFHFLKQGCSDGYGEGLGIALEDAVFGRMTCVGTFLRWDGRKAMLDFDLRFPPGTDMEAVQQKIEKTAREGGLQRKKSVCTNGCFHDLQDWYVKILLSSYERVYGKGGSPYVMGGNTYARFFNNGIGFGPGIPRTPENDRCWQNALEELHLPKGHGGGHPCDEVQSISGLCDAVKIYVDALQNLDNEAGG